MSPEELLDVLRARPTRSAASLRSLVGSARRARTDRPGQYHLDTVADAAILPVLHAAGLRVLSEESGWTGDPGSPITVVLDPVDGSTNCARGIPYWGISACALDADGMLCSLVENGATGAAYTAVRGGGAWLDDAQLTTAVTTDIVRGDGRAATLPEPPWPGGSAARSARACWRCATLRPGTSMPTTTRATISIMAGTTSEGCSCARKQVRWPSTRGRELVVADADARRQVLAACTPALLDVLRAEVDG